MSAATVTYTITCDEPGCAQRHAVILDHPQPHGANEPHHAADGWTIDPHTGLRCCPAHGTQG